VVAVDRPPVDLVEPEAQVGATVVRPQRRHEAACRVAVDEQAVVPVLVADDPHRLVQFRVVLGEVGAEVRRLVRLDAAAVLAQVERVEVDAPRGEEVGQVGLEEVVDEAVDVQHGGAGRLACAAGDERRTDRALVVVLEAIVRQV
jgi:hypothetical protein